MDNRPTKEFVSPGGHKVVFYTYLNGFEAQEIKTLLLGALKVQGQPQVGGSSVADLPGSFIIEQEKKAFNFLIVSVDGETNDPVSKLLDLPSAEYEAVVKEINDIVNPTKPEK